MGKILLDEAVAKGEALEEVGGLSLSFNTVLARPALTMGNPPGQRGNCFPSVQAGVPIALSVVVLESRVLGGVTLFEHRAQESP